MKKSLIIAGIFVSTSIFAQDDLIKKVIGNASIQSKFIFKDIIDLEDTSVKNQGSAGTCWSYSGNSFIESEMIRMKKKPVDIAEIFTARQVYLAKSRNYILLGGTGNLGDGAELHDVMNIIRKNGAMPQTAYNLDDYGKGTTKSGEMQKKIKEILDAFLKNPNNKSATWVKDVSDYMDSQLGKIPENFVYGGKTYTPKTFAKEVIGIDANDYIEISNYKDTPYYEKMVQPVTDNWSHDSLYNVPMATLTDAVDNALAKGFTVGWATDVSESYFSWKNGVAIVPNVDDLYNITDDQKKIFFDGPAKEKEISEDMRLDALYTMNTTDDHGMHIVGKAKDQNGKEYYKVKNSWGETNDYKGYLYVSKTFVQLKTTALMLNKNSLTKDLRTKLKV